MAQIAIPSIGWDAQANKIASARLDQSCSFTQSCEEFGELASRLATPVNGGELDAIAPT